MLNEKPIIQKLVVAVMLVLFTISFIPKTYFHDVIASHTDSVEDCQHPDKGQACLRQPGFNCDFNELVVAAPYLLFESSINFFKPSEYLTVTESFYQLTLQHFFFGTESRGPPSVV